MSIELTKNPKRKYLCNLEKTKNKGTDLSASLDAIAVQVLAAQGNYQVSVQQFVQHKFL